MHLDLKPAKKKLMIFTSLIIFRIEHQVKKEYKATQTDFVLKHLNIGTIVSYKCEDPFLQGYYDSYFKWEKFGERFLKIKIIKKIIRFLIMIP